MNEVKAEHVLPSGQIIRLVHGDITEERVDAIVNAANSHLAHGGGVAAAIVRKGGEVIQRESDAWVRQHGPVPTGSAAITSAGALPCRAVIHAVGPIWRGGSEGEEEQLRSAARSSFALAAERGFASLALPAISAGIFGFPVDRCAEILLEAARDFLRAHPESSLREIRFVLFDALTLEAFLKAFHRIFESPAEPHA
ncbi:MAG: macro domain-containing protein [Blastocatellia bacterium]|nr:macro domain-containing protein [Blastocatellia bacterium]MCS7156912.1 macro domain-containing protein [Blastocatellia bacterium]MDW8167604.1 macro domain-containing protein [Acidobacteriota bacterium]MDW8256204.1 macro domain-containing protein [Acidobacteriota bacterium]